MALHLEVEHLGGEPVTIDLDDVRVILSSGYSKNEQAKAILEKGCQAFIQKPFSISDLSMTIRQVLDKK